MLHLQVVCSGVNHVVGMVAVVLDGVVDIDGAPGPKHLLNPHIDLILWRAPTDARDLLGSQEGAGQQHVRKVVRVRTHSRGRSRCRC